MTRFDLHVLKRFWSAFALLQGLLVVIFVVMDYVEYIDDFMDRGATQAEIFGSYYLNYIPEILRLTSPLAVFLAAIYVTARLAQSMQLSALQSAGVSVLRYLAPLAVSGVVITVVMFAFNGWIVPRSNTVVHAFQNQYYHDAPESSFGTEIYRQAGDYSFLAAHSFNQRSGRASRVTLLETDSTHNALTRRIDAAEMVWDSTAQTWSLVSPELRAFQKNRFLTLRLLPSLDTSLAVLPVDLARSTRAAARMTIPEARSLVESLQRTGSHFRGRPLVEYYGKFSYPLANLILILVGVPLATRRRRGGQAIQFALGLGVAFVYLALQRVIEPLGYAEVIAPILASWLPHVVFLGVAIVLVWKATKT